MFVGVPAGIITVLLVLAAFLVALYGPSFREGNSLPAISAFCTCNLLAVLHLHLRQLCACTCPSEAIGQRNVQNQRETTQSA